MRPPTKMSATTRSKEPGASRLERRPRVRHADPDPAGRAGPAAWLRQRQPFPDDRDQVSVVVYCQLRGAWPVAATYRASVSAPPPKCSTRSRLPSRGCQIDQVAEPAHVLELQVARVRQVDVGLRETAAEQGPASWPVGVGDDFDCASRARLVRHASHRPAARPSLSTCQNEPMTVTRLLTIDDVPAVAELYRVNRDFLAPWEPIRPDDYYTVAGQRAAVQGALLRNAEGTAHPRVIVNEAGAVAGRINLSDIVRGPFQSANLGYWVGRWRQRPGPGHRGSPGDRSRWPSANSACTGSRPAFAAQHRVAAGARAQRLHHDRGGARLPEHRRPMAGPHLVPGDRVRLAGGPLKRGLCRGLWHDAALGQPLAWLSRWHWLSGLARRLGREEQRSQDRAGGRYPASDQAADRQAMQERGRRRVAEGLCGGRLPGAGDLARDLDRGAD